MIGASKPRIGMTFVTSDGKFIRALEVGHHKPGKGNTAMRMELRNIRTGSAFDTTYRPGEKFEQATIETCATQYLYKMNNTACLMDTESYEQYEIPAVNVEQELLYILESSKVKIQSYDIEVIGVIAPIIIELTITDTRPLIRRATVTGSGKPAIFGTGPTINVPDFTKIGQKLAINTQEGTYVSRA